MNITKAQAAYIVEQVAALADVAANTDLDCAGMLLAQIAHSLGIDPTTVPVYQALEIECGRRATI